MARRPAAFANPDQRWKDFAYSLADLDQPILSLRYSALATTPLVYGFRIEAVEQMIRLPTKPLTRAAHSALRRTLLQHPRHS